MLSLPPFYSSSSPNSFLPQDFCTYCLLFPECTTFPLFSWLSRVHLLDVKMWIIFYPVMFTSSSALPLKKIVWWLFFKRLPHYTLKEGRDCLLGSSVVTQCLKMCSVNICKMSEWKIPDPCIAFHSSLVGLRVGASSPLVLEWDILGEWVAISLWSLYQESKAF